MDESKPVVCIFCGSEARIIHFDRNMWYIQCSNPDCKKNDKYSCLGSTKNNSVEQWNFINRANIVRKNEKSKKF